MLEWRKWICIVLLLFLEPSCVKLVQFHLFHHGPFLLDAFSSIQMDLFRFYSMVLLSKYLFIFQRKESQNRPFFCQSNTLVTYSSETYQLNHSFLIHSISTPILAYYTLYPHSISLSLPSSFTPVSIRPLLLNLDDAWIRNDTNTLKFLLQSISNPLLSSIYSPTTTLTVCKSF